MKKSDTDSSFEEGDRVVFVNNLLTGYHVGKSNPLQGTKHACPGTVIKVSWPIVYVKWDNGTQNDYRSICLRHHHDLPETNPNLLFIQSKTRKKGIQWTLPAITYNFACTACGRTRINFYIDQTKKASLTCSCRSRYMKVTSMHSVCTSCGNSLTHRELEKIVRVEGESRCPSCGGLSGWAAR